jgi:hypothetical protein
MGSVDNQALLSSLNHTSPTCLLESALGPQLKSVEASTGGNGKGAGEPSRPIGWSKPKPKAVYRQKTKLGMGVDQQEFIKPDPKGKAPAQPSSQAPSSSAHPWVRMDAGQSGDPGATPSSGGLHAAQRTPVFSGRSLTVGDSVGSSACPALVGLASAKVLGDSRAIMSPARVQSEQHQALSKSRVDDLAVFPQVPTDLHHVVVVGLAGRVRVNPSCWRVGVQPDS